MITENARRGAVEVAYKQNERMSEMQITQTIYTDTSLAYILRSCPAPRVWCLAEMQCKDCDRGNAKVHVLNLGSGWVHTNRTNGLASWPRHARDDARQASIQVSIR